MKIRPAVLELFPAFGRTDGRTDGLSERNARSAGLPVRLRNTSIPRGEFGPKPARVLTAQGRIVAANTTARSNLTPQP
jgi:hypothetical protein